MSRRKTSVKHRKFGLRFTAFLDNLSGIDNKGVKIRQILVHKFFQIFLKFFALPPDFWKNVWYNMSIDEHLILNF